MRESFFAGLVLLAATVAAGAEDAGVCQEEVHRVVLVKTHKTGSSTLANILYRFGESRGLNFMLPKDDLRLGWPGAFPGSYERRPGSGGGRRSSHGSYDDGPGLPPAFHDQDRLPDPPRDQAEADIFDVVAHHAVFNRPVMLQFVPKAKFITIVRDPVAQFTSAWYFFNVGRAAGGATARRGGGGGGRRPLSMRGPPRHGAGAGHHEMLGARRLQAGAPEHAAPPRHRAGPPISVGAPNHMLAPKHTAPSRLRAGPPIPVGAPNHVLAAAARSPLSPLTPPGMRLRSAGPIILTLESLEGVFPRGNASTDPAAHDLGSLGRLDTHTLSRTINSQAFTLGWTAFRDQRLREQPDLFSKERAHARAAVVADFAPKPAPAPPEPELSPLLPPPPPTSEPPERAIAPAATAGALAASLAADRDTELVREWLATLDKGLDVVLVVERLDEALVVMGDKLCWGLGAAARAAAARERKHREGTAASNGRAPPAQLPSSPFGDRTALLTYLPVNQRRHAYDKVDSDRALAARLLELLPVDRRLYAYANQRLDAELQSLAARAGANGAGGGGGGSASVSARISELKQASAALRAQCQPLVDDARRRAQRRRLTAATATRRGDNIDSSSRNTTASQRRLGEAFGVPYGGDIDRARVAGNRAAMRQVAEFQRRRAEEEAEEGALSLSSEASPSGGIGGAPSRATLRAAAMDLGTKAPPETKKGKEKEEEEEEEEAPLLSATCWRHAADQRSYSNHLKALAGIKCSSRKYKLPVDFDHLPAEIAASDAACMAPPHGGPGDRDMAALEMMRVPRGMVRGGPGGADDAGFGAPAGAMGRAPAVLQAVVPGAATLEADAVGGSAPRAVVRVGLAKQRGREGAVRAMREHPRVVVGDAVAPAIRPEEAP